MNLHRLADHRRALFDIGLGRDRLGQRVDLGVAVAAEIELTLAALARRCHQRKQRVVRVIAAGRPPKQIERRIARQDLREVATFGFGRQIHFDARLRQHRRHRLADFFVVDVAIVRAIHPHFETLRVAGFCQELLRRFHVERQTLVHVGLKAVDARRDHQPRRRRGSTHHNFLNGIDVDRLIKRLPHPLVLERILTLDTR